MHKARTWAGGPWSQHPAGAQQSCLRPTQPPNQGLSESGGMSSRRAWASHWRWPCSVVSRPGSNPNTSVPAPHLLWALPAPPSLLRGPATPTPPAQRPGTLCSLRVSDGCSVHLAEGRSPRWASGRPACPHADGWTGMGSRGVSPRPDAGPSAPRVGGRRCRGHGSQGGLSRVAARIGARRSRAVSRAALSCRRPCSPRRRGAIRAGSTRPGLAIWGVI